jgi:hypothetical protein
VATKHEKGPWKVTSSGGGCARIGTDETHTIALVGGIGQAVANANASRVVSCINLCEGMNVQEMRQMRAAWDKKKQEKKARIHEYNFSCRSTRTPSARRAEA